MKPGRKTLTQEEADLSLVKRFWSKVNKDGPLPSFAAVREHPEIEGINCWEWTASTNAYGYGVIGVKVNGTNTTQLVSRTVWLLETKEYPKNDICHKCDNPRCVRWCHLFDGTAEDNCQDAKRKGRLLSITKQTYCKRGHLLENAPVYDGRRCCGKCKTLLKRIARKKEKHEQR